MSIEYRIYANNGAGGPVDYTTVIATVSTLTWTGSALTASSDTTFAVRTYDTVTGFDDGGVDARVRILLDASQVDITSRPVAPTGVSALATAGGGARIDWSFPPTTTPPTGYRVWLTAGTTVNYLASPNATISAFPGIWRYSANVTGMADGATYTVGVAAYNATAQGLPAEVGIVGSATGPAAVEALSSSLTYAG